MIIRVIGVRSIEDGKNSIAYMTWPEYATEYMNDDRFTAGDVFIDIPEEFEPCPVVSMEKGEALLTFKEKEYKLGDVLVGLSPNLFSKEHNAVCTDDSEPQMNVPCLMFVNEENDDCDIFALLHSYDKEEIELMHDMFYGSDKEAARLCVPVPKKEGE